MQPYRFCVAGLFVAMLALLMPSAAHAGLMFGADETIHRIQDVEVKGAKDEALFLGYKTTIMFVGLGAYVTDDGYVFGQREKPSTFYRIPPEEMKAFQQKGLIPDPLPTYRLGIFDYAFGYSLWIGGAGWLIVSQWSAFMRRRRTRGAAAAPPAVASATAATR